LAQALPQTRRRAGQAQAFKHLPFAMTWQMEVNEHTPLMDNTVEGGLKNRFAQADRQLTGSGSWWDTVGPITSAVMTLPVLLAH
jgi:hypothetical protein